MPNIQKLRYNGIQSDSLGIYITGAGTYNAAELDYTAYQVAGKNGDVLISNHRYKNITVTYPAFVVGNFETKAQALRNFMRAVTTYAKISDTYDSSHFRMGMANGILEFEPTNRNDAANFELVFNCKPQRFLSSGDIASSITSGTVLTNPTQFTALPTITFKNISSSSSYIQVVNSLGTFKLTATDAYTGFLTIDCETQNVYYGSSNHNDLFTGDFPVLASGTNTVTFSGLSTVKITPRWWEL